MATDELGVTFCSPKETIADTLRWLTAEGKISRKQLGDLAG
jgi:hypothetical protein